MVVGWTYPTEVTACLQNAKEKRRVLMGVILHANIWKEHNKKDIPGAGARMAASGDDSE